MNSLSAMIKSIFDERENFNQSLLKVVIVNGSFIREELLPPENLEDDFFECKFPTKLGIPLKAKRMYSPKEWCPCEPCLLMLIDPKTGKVDAKWQTENCGVMIFVRSDNKDFSKDDYLKLIIYIAEVSNYYEIKDKKTSYFSGKKQIKFEDFERNFLTPVAFDSSNYEFKITSSFMNDLKLKLNIRDTFIIDFRNSLTSVVVVDGLNVEEHLLSQNELRRGFEECFATRMLGVPINFKRLYKQTTEPDRFYGIFLLIDPVLGLASKKYSVEGCGVLLFAKSNNKNLSKQLFLDLQFYLKHLMSFYPYSTQGNAVTFDQFKQKHLNQKSFDSFRIDMYRDFSINFEIKDSVILNEELFNELKKLFLMDGKHYFFSKFKKNQLIYRASAHGSDPREFHKKCDGISSTLSIFITEPEKYIFGGFASSKWDSEDLFVYDKDAFIFSLVNKENRPTIMNCIESKYAITSRYTRAQSFETGHDISIYLMAPLTNEYSLYGYANIGHNFSFNLYPPDSDKATSFIGGETNFPILDMEVYHFF